jgi:hypothetical protein
MRKVLYGALMTPLLLLCCGNYLSGLPVTHHVEEAVIVSGQAQAPAQPQQAEQRYSAFNAVQIAKADCDAITALNSSDLDPQYVRYLSLHNVPEAQRAWAKAVVDFVLNSLNPTYRKIIRTAGLPANAAVPVVIRVNLNDYGIPPGAWNRLAEKGSGATPIPDPYFHTYLNSQQTLPPTTVRVPVNLVFPNWTPTLEVMYQRGTMANACEVHVTAPGAEVVYFDGKAVETKNEPTRKFVTPQLTTRSAYSATVRVTGTYERQPYDASLKVHMEAGKRALLTMQVPRPIESKATEAKEEKEEETPDAEDVVSKAAAEDPKDVESKEPIYAAAPWLSLEPELAARGSTIAAVISATGTRNPILRADWFVTNVTLAPAYYDMIGLPLRDNPDKEAAKKRPKVFLEKDFEKLMNANTQSAARDIVAAITDTRIVTLHNRVLHRYNTVTGITGGYYWRSQDTDSGIDDQDYLTQLAYFDHPNFVATEIIASGRNGLNFFFVADNKGVALDLAAASVAQHGDAMPCRYQDKQVWVSRNCMLCHANGMITVKDKVRAIARNQIALLIANHNKDQALTRKIDEAFAPDPKFILDTDNAKFLASVRAACGKDGNAVAKAQEEMIWSYWDRPVNLERMAWDAGIAPDVLRQMLKEGVNLHYSLVSVLQDPEEPTAVLAWERQGFAALMTYVIGYQPRKK